MVGPLMGKTQGTEPHARVFISSGQNKESDEVAVASAVRDQLSEMGFDPYIAVQEQTFRGLKENIFRQYQSHATAALTRDPERSVKTEKPNFGTGEPLPQRLIFHSARK